MCVRTNNNNKNDNNNNKWPLGRHIDFIYAACWVAGIIVSIQLIWALSYEALNKLSSGEQLELTT